MWGIYYRASWYSRHYREDMLVCAIGTGSTGNNNKESAVTKCKRAALVAKINEYAFIDKIFVANGFLCLALRIKPFIYACEATSVLTRDIDRRAADLDFFDANAECKK